MSAGVGGSTQPVISDLSYQPFGGTAGWSWGNGLEQTTSRDLDGRVIGLSTTQGSIVRQSLTYGYNEADEITAITNAVNAGLSQQFAYDANGNRTSHTWGGTTTH